MAGILLELDYGMTTFKSMVNGKPKGKTQRRFHHGGARENAGRKPADNPKTKVSVSLNTNVLHNALAQWGKPLSNLVEMLLDQYSANPITEGGMRS